MNRYKITIEYNGSQLVGWQHQKEGLSVQDCIQTAVYDITRQNPQIFGAGRTDAGVHALGQVAHFDIETNSSEYQLKEGLNFSLRNHNFPVSIIDLQKTSPDFHARFSATGKEYIYKILNRKAQPVIYKDLVWWVSFPLDIKAMQEGAAFLLGNHDFTSFRASGCQAKSPIKTLDKVEIIQKEDLIELHFFARSFLHHQVRNMVGTLKMVGDGHLTPQDIASVLEKKDRSAAGPTAPACGLYLKEVFYS